METTVQAGSERVPVPEDLSGAVNCRRWLRRRLDTLRLPAPVRADLELVASELIANAFLHAPAPRSVWLMVPAGIVDDVVSELELELPRDDKVDLLLRPVPVAVRALAAGLGWHPPPGERDLFSVELVGHHPHLSGVITEDVRGFLEVLDHVVRHGAILSALTRLTLCQKH